MFIRRRELGGILAFASDCHRYYLGPTEVE